MRTSFLLAAVAALPVAACGGGGSSGGVGSLPAPPSTPVSPASAPPVTIFAAPTPGEYASVGASVAGPGGNLDTYASANTQYGPISTAQDDQARFRYTSGGYYEVKLAAADWDRLIHYKGSVDPPPNDNYFQPASIPMNYGYVVTRNSRESGYSFSELASWGSKPQGQWGYTAFGVPTSPGGVPTSGTANFEGVVSGTTDIMAAENLYGGYFPLSTDGFVTLNFDLAKGSLGGRMDLFLPDGMNPIPLQSFNFSETIFSPGSTTYSGRFETAVSGQNFFLGRFTGPSAQETIGAWAVPFIFSQPSTYTPPDGQPHQAFGAWIAKRSN